MTRVVVVSGGGTGIGRAVAHRFAGDGDQVVLIGRRADVLRTSASEVGAHALPADLSDPEQAARARDEVVARWGRVDVLVNAAGGNSALDPPPATVDGLAQVAWTWRQNLDANTMTAVLLTEALKPHLSRPGARVVLVSSIAAYRGSGSGSYAASKAALHPYAYDLAAELGPDGITVNVVAPGFVDDTGFFRNQLSDQRRQTLIEQTLTKRAGEPDDVAATVHWLAAPAAGHLTAQIVQVNGGAERGR